jgi:hypothetical protein
MEKIISVQDFTPDATAKKCYNMSKMVAIDKKIIKIILIYIKLLIIILPFLIEIVSFPYYILPNGSTVHHKKSPR